MSCALFVSPNGNDTNPGTKESPLRTLHAARDRLRQLKAQGKVTDEVRIEVAAGVYHFGESLVLDAQDGGSGTATITYAAAPGASVRLIGGQLLAADQFTTVTDDAVLQRLPEATHKHVQQIDLKAAGITDFGRLRSRGFSRQPSPAHMELFFNDRAMTLAQWPNKGEWVKIAGFPEATGKNDGHGTIMGQLDAGFYYEGDRPRQWADLSDVWVHGYWAYDWANSYEHIASIDLDKRHIHTDGDRGLYGYRIGQRFCFVNVLEELDQPGEYYVDTDAGMLYFWPPADLAGGECAVSVLESPLIELRDTSHVRIEGFDLGYCRGNGIRIINGSDVVIHGCTMRHIGNDAVRIEGGTKHGVERCHIYDTGDGGVNMLGGDRATLTPAEHYARNCHFHGQARWSRCYFPAVHMQGVGHLAAHNHIHDHPHCAILYWGNDHIIEYNDIHDTCYETGDVGAVYTGRDWTFQGCIVRYNHLHEINGPGHLGSIAVYLDDCVSGQTIYGNLFRNTQMAIMLGGGRDNVIENNIFIRCQPSLQLDCRGISTGPVWQNMVKNTMKERLLAMKHHQPPYATRFPQLQTIDAHLKAGDGVPPENNIITRNISVDSKWIGLGFGATEAMFEWGENLVDVDPLFIDAAGGDYRLKAESPAWKLGFKALPLEKIGIQPSDD